MVNEPALCKGWAGNVPLPSMEGHSLLVQDEKRLRKWEKGTKMPALSSKNMRKTRSRQWMRAKWGRWREKTIIPNKSGLFQKKSCTSKASEISVASHSHFPKELREIQHSPHTPDSGEVRTGPGANSQQHIKQPDTTRQKKKKKRNKNKIK